MNPQRRVTLAVLFVMTVLLAGVSVFITIRIQQNNAATDANASGFGDTATTNKFGSVFDEFASYACTEFLSQNKLNLLGEKTTVITTISSVEDVLAEVGPQSRLPVSCLYKISDSQSIQISLYSYDENSTIDDSEEALFTRINANLVSVLDKQNYGPDGFYVTGFLGQDASPTSYISETTSVPSCRTNLFHSQNDFEYIEVIYNGFTDCNAILKDNQKISGIIAATVYAGMSNVNKKF